MHQLAIKLLGDFRATLDDVPLTDFRMKKVKALLIYLAADSQSAHRREQIMTLLWPGMPESSARANLRQVLFQLRRATGARDDKAAVPLVVADRHTIQLNPDAAITVDTKQFDDSLVFIREHNHVELLTCHTCFQALESAVSLYQGEFLTDFYLEDSNDFEDWAEITRQQYRRKMLDALNALTTMAMRSSNLIAAQSYAQQQIEIDPLYESAYRQLMEAMARNGQRAAALALFDNYRRLVAEELGMEPTAQTADLYDQIRAGTLDLSQPQTAAVRGYELKEAIGEGAYGVAYRAVQPAIGREVVVKAIRRRHANDPAFIRRFEGEAQLVARLEHPYIVPLYDYWREPDGAYLVMRYMRGGNLRAAIESGPYAPDKALEILDQVSQALSAAHLRGVIHRDIKPANILLDETGNAYLSDFGIAKDLTGDVERHNGGTVAGSPEYVSPEVIRNEPVGPPSDIYSLGILLYEILGGRLPYTGNNVANTLYKQLHEPLPMLGNNYPELPPQIDTVVQRATAKNPEHRYRSALDMAEAFRQALRHPETTPLVPIAGPAVTANPYKGLRPFQEADASDYFGRQALVEQLVKRLSDDGVSGSTNRFLAVVGPSGSGKSSAVRAGLIPALREGAVAGSENWYVAEMTPGHHPLEELEKALWPVAVDPPPSLVEPMRRDDQGLLRTLPRILPDREATLLLVIDQFEELYTLVDNERRRDQFIDSILTALAQPESPLRVVITLRADFYDRPLQRPQLGRWLRDNTQVVLPLSPEELSLAISRPAQRAGVALEDGLTPAIVADVQAEPGALPLLQYALTELFDHRQDNQMTLAAYDEFGGVSGALGRRAEELYENLDAAGQDSTRQIFLRLVTLGDGPDATRRRVLRSELESMAIGGRLAAERETAATVGEVLDLFGRYRLLTFDRDTVTRSPTVEVAHEALLQKWPRLRHWLDENRDDIRLQRSLAVAAAEWGESGQEDGYLLRGARLRQFDGWAAGAGLVLTGEERAFLEASLAARAGREAAAAAQQDREKALEAHSRNRLRQLVVVLAGAAAVAAVLSLAAVGFARQARLEARQASSRELAATAINSLEADPERSALLALEGLSAARTIEVENALHRAVPEMHLLRTQVIPVTAESLAINSAGDRIAAADNAGDVFVLDAATGEELLRFPASEGVIFGMTFTPDGRHIVTASEDATARVWDAISGEPILVIDHGAPLSDVDFSSDGARLVTAGADAAARVWDAATGEPLLVLEGHEPADRQGSLHPGGVVNVGFTPDDRRIVTAGADGTVRLWDAQDGRQQHLVRGHTNEVYLSVSPDGDRLLTAGQDGQVRVWNISSVESVPELMFATGQVPPARDAAFSPDGRLVAVAGQDGAARIWDAFSGQSLLSLVGHAGQVDDMAFTPESDRLLTVAADATLREWDLAPGYERLTLADGRPLEVAYSPDGALLATAQGDGSLAIRDSATGETTITLAGHPGQETIFLDFSPDGQNLVSSSWDMTAKVWDVGAGTEVVTLQGHEGFVWRAVFSPDGRQVATAGGDATARVWDAKTGEELRVLTADTFVNGVVDIAWSPDGGRIATSSCDVRLWDAATGQNTMSIIPEGDICAWGVGFGPDSSQLATGGVDGSVTVWDVSGEEGQLAQSFSGHTALVTRLAFSPDGEHLATGSFDGTAKVWDLVKGQEWLTLPSTNTVTKVAFSPDGTQLATAGWDGQVRVWILDLDDLVTLTHSRLTRDLTAAECREFLHVDACPDRAEDAGGVE